jgi:hypothetical protein
MFWLGNMRATHTGLIRCRNHAPYVTELVHHVCHLFLGFLHS